MKIKDAIEQQADILCKSDQIADVVAILVKHGVYPHPIVADLLPPTFVLLRTNSTGGTFYTLYYKHCEIFPLITAGEFIAHNPISTGTKRRRRDHAGRYNTD